MTTTREAREYGTPADRRAANAAIFPADRFHSLTATVYHVTIVPNAKRS